MWKLQKDSVKKKKMEKSVSNTLCNIFLELTISDLHAHNDTLIWVTLVSRAVYIVRESKSKTHIIENKREKRVPASVHGKYQELTLRVSENKLVIRCLYGNSSKIYLSRVFSLEISHEKQKLFNINSNVETKNNREFARKMHM